MRIDSEVTVTVGPASDVPGASSVSFIIMPDILEMPPNGKSAGTLNMISTVWLAASALSVLRRIHMVMLMWRSGEAIADSTLAIRLDPISAFAFRNRGRAELYTDPTGGR